MGFIKCEKCGKTFDYNKYYGLCPKCGRYNKETKVNDNDCSINGYIDREHEQAHQSVEQRKNEEIYKNYLDDEPNVTIDENGDFQNYLNRKRSDTVQSQEVYNDMRENFEQKRTESNTKAMKLLLIILFLFFFGPFILGLFITLISCLVFFFV